MQFTQRSYSHHPESGVMAAKVGDDNGLAGKVSAFYQHLNAKALDPLSAIYSQDVTFIDPAATAAIIRGLAMLPASIQRMLCQSMERSMSTPEEARA